MIRSRSGNIIRNGMFLGMLMVPGIVMLITARQDVSQREARTLAQRPTLIELFEQPYQFTALWDAYLKDHFGLREGLLDLNAALRRNLESPASGRAIVGKQGWLFFSEGLLPTGESSGDSEQKVSRQVELIAAIARRLERQGTPLLVVPTPDKHTVFPEQLPRWLERAPRSQAMNALIAGIRANGVDMVDVVEALGRSKNQYPLFYLTDTHWTPIGAALAFNAVATRSHGALKPVQVTMGSQLMAGAPRDLSRMAGFDGEPLDWAIPGFNSSYPQAVREALHVADNSQQSPFVLHRDGPGSRVLIVGDSFSAYWPSYALESANTVYWSHHNLCRADWSKLLALDVDLVIYQMVERTIGCPPLEPQIFESIKASAD